MSFHLSISNVHRELVELSIHNELDNEALAEVLMTAFQEMKEKHPMVLRVIFFSAMESLRPESELIQKIWEDLQEE